MTDPRPDLAPTPGGREDGRRGRAALVGSVAFLALVLVIGLVVGIASRHGGTPPAPSGGVAGPVSPAPTAVPSTSAVAAGTTGPSAVASPLPTQIPVTAPAGITWTSFQGVALPYSATAGPARVDPPVYAGYEHSPTGALTALVQLEIRYLLTPGDGWRQVVAQQVVPNAGREAFTKFRATVTDTDAAPGTYGQIAGFAFVTYSPDAAVIQLATRYSTGTMSAVTGTVRWQGGDWKLELQPSGSITPTRQEITSLSGFVPWGI